MTIRQMNSQKNSQKTIALAGGVAVAVGAAAWSIVHSLSQESQGPVNKPAGGHSSQTLPPVGSPAGATTAGATAPGTPGPGAVSQTSLKTTAGGGTKSTVNPTAPAGADPFNPLPPVAGSPGSATAGSATALTPVPLPVRNPAPSPAAPTSAPQGSAGYSPESPRTGGAPAPALPRVPPMPHSELAPGMTRPAAPATAASQPSAPPPVLVGTLLGERASAVVRVGDVISIVPVGGTVDSWKVVSVTQGHAKLRGPSGVRTVTIGQDETGKLSVVQANVIEVAELPRGAAKAEDDRLLADRPAAAPDLISRGSLASHAGIAASGLVAPAASRASETSLETAPVLVTSPQPLHAMTAAAKSPAAGPTTVALLTPELRGTASRAQGVEATARDAGLSVQGSEARSPAALSPGAAAPSAVWTNASGLDSRQDGPTLAAAPALAAVSRQQAPAVESLQGTAPSVYALTGTGPAIASGPNLAVAVLPKVQDVGNQDLGNRGQAAGYRAQVTGFGEQGSADSARDSGFGLASVDSKLAEPKLPFAVAILPEAAPSILAPTIVAPTILAPSTIWTAHAVTPARTPARIAVPGLTIAALPKRAPDRTVTLIAAPAVKAVRSAAAAPKAAAPKVATDEDEDAPSIGELPVEGSLETPSIAPAIAELPVEGRLDSSSSAPTLAEAAGIVREPTWVGYAKAKAFSDRTPVIVRYALLVGALNPAAHFSVPTSAPFLTTPKGR